VYIISDVDMAIKYNIRANALGAQPRLRPTPLLPKRYGHKANARNY